VARRSNGAVHRALTRDDAAAIDVLETFASPRRRLLHRWLDSWSVIGDVVRTALRHETVTKIPAVST
jgi:hypothetical protein